MVWPSRCRGWSRLRAQGRRVTAASVRDRAERGADVSVDAGRDKGALDELPATLVPWKDSLVLSSGRTRARPRRSRRACGSVVPFALSNAHDRVLGH